MFEIGEIVLLKTLKKEATVVDKIRTGWYRVRLGALQVECAESELSKLGVEKKSKKQKPLYTMPQERSSSQPSKTDVVDLHGKTVEEALRIIENKVNECILKSVYCLEVIHGHGTGRVKKAVHDYLQRIGITSFKIDPANAGVTKVYFD